MSHATVSYWSAMIRVEAEEFRNFKKVGAPECCFVGRVSHAARYEFLLDEVAPVLFAFLGCCVQSALGERKHSH
jgi:hypothetical protein